ncbi:hypothetical protein ACOSQ3_013298 [Xanthoceras sorbifolium]
MIHCTTIGIPSRISYGIWRSNHVSHKCLISSRSRTCSLSIILRLEGLIIPIIALECSMTISMADLARRSGIIIVVPSSSTSALRSSTILSSISLSSSIETLT